MRARRSIDLLACRERERAAYLRNQVAKKAAIAAYYAKNAKAIKETARQRYAANAELIKLQSAAYRAANHDKVYEWNGTRRAQLRKALPSWADRSAIRAIYARSKRLTTETGIAHHVDHEIPLSHHLVCGLHVPENLRVLTAADNLAKRNSFT